LLATFIKIAVSFFVGASEHIMVDLAVFYALGTILVVAGVIVVVLAIIFGSKGDAKKGKVRGAGIIMVGPIPIIFGTDKKSVKSVLAMSLGLSVVVLIILLLYYWLLR
jgi:uncharacterized protein (TIGR00304 family)